MWAEKTQTVREPTLSNKYIYWGKALEPLLASKYAELHACRLISSEPLERADKPWFAGTPDRLIVDHGSHYPSNRAMQLILKKRGVEFKTAKSAHWPKWGELGATLKDWDTAINHPLPPDYVAQCQWYMRLMDFPEWDLVVKLDSADYREYRLLRDDAWLDAAEERCERFWRDYVLTKRPPPLDHGTTCNRYLDSLFKEHSERVRDADPCERLLIQNWRALSGEVNFTETILKAAKESIRDLELRVYDLTKKQHKLKANESAIKALLRERIGRDAGIRTEEGDEVTWKRSSKGTRGTRTMRKQFANGESTESKPTSAST